MKRIGLFWLRIETSEGLVRCQCSKRQLRKTIIGVYIIYKCTGWLGRRFDIYLLFTIFAGPQKSFVQLGFAGL